MQASRKKAEGDRRRSPNRELFEREVGSQTTHREMSKPGESPKERKAKRAKGML